MDGYGLGEVSGEEDWLGRLDRGTLEIIVGASVVRFIFPLPLPFELEGALDVYGIGKVSGEGDWVGFVGASVVGFISPLPLPLLLPFELEGDTLEILVGAPVVGSIFPLPLPFPLLLPCVYEEEEISGFDLFRHVKRRNGATADNYFLCILGGLKTIFRMFSFFRSTYLCCRWNIRWCRADGWKHGYWRYFTRCLTDCWRMADWR